MQTLVRYARTHAMKSVRSENGRGSNAPSINFRPPKRPAPELAALRIVKYCIESDVIEWIGICSFGREGDFHHYVGFGSQNQVPGLGRKTD